LIDAYARDGNPLKFKFPEGKVPDLNFSFSGIKTNLLYFLRDHSANDESFIKNNLQDICASYQHSLVEYLSRKTREAIRKYQPACIALAGGVSANSGLRHSFINLSQSFGIPLLLPAFEYCTDNAAMVAIAGHYLLEKGQTTTLDALPYTRN
jgi:N6-L-threonylcarbamoyladenine synthase